MILCELMSTKVVPVIRRVSAVKMAGRMKQKEIAAELGITEAAVSHYLSKRRGSHGSAVERAVGRSVEKFLGRGMTHSERVCAVCRDLRASGDLCLIHAETSPSFKTRGCRICEGAS